MMYMTTVSTLPFTPVLSDMQQTAVREPRIVRDHKGHRGNNVITSFGPQRIVLTALSATISSTATSYSICRKLFVAYESSTDRRRVLEVAPWRHRGELW